MCDADNAKTATSSCNEHPYGCGDALHKQYDSNIGFLRTVPTRFTRAEIWGLRSRARMASISDLASETEENLYAQLEETLDLLDAVMARDEEEDKVQGFEGTRARAEELSQILTETRAEQRQGDCVDCSQGHSPCPNCLGCDNCCDYRVGPC